MKHTGKLFFASVFLAGCLALCLGSCRNFVEPERSDDYMNFLTMTDRVTWSSVFESFWTGMNNNYLFWSEESVDWDDVYDIYKPKFDVLDFKNKEHSDTAFSYFQAMTEDLCDGHYKLMVYDDFGKSKDISPVAARFFKEKGGNYGDPDSYSDTLKRSDFFAEDDGIGTTRQQAVRKYILDSGGPYSFSQVGSNWKQWGYPVADDVPNFKATTGRILEPEGFILYFAFSNFTYGLPGGNGIVSLYRSFTERGVYDDIKASYSNITDDDDLWEQIKDDEGENHQWLLAVEIRQVWNITQQFFDDLKDPDLKGVIIDLRSNPGGNVFDLSYLWGKLTSTERVAGYSRTKLGNNRLDYSPWMPLKIIPDPENGADVTVPIAVLVNKLSVSCAEMSAMFFMTLPNAYIVGGETLGGHGLITDNRTWNGGKFTGISFEIGSMACVQTRTADNISYEGKGLPPDYLVPFDYDKLQAGQDTRLEAAIQVIQDHQ